MRPTSCLISPESIRRNVVTLRDRVAPTPLCAVVKANGYGHGAVVAANAALEGGATWLAVAIAEEGVELRRAGIDAPILVLSEQDASSNGDIIEAGLTPTLYTPGGIDAFDRAADGYGPIRVHVGVDTGMRRVGSEPNDLRATVAAIEGSKNLKLEAIWTHCPVADEPDNPFTDGQLARFDEVTNDIDIETHAGNSAVAFTRPNRAASMVRCGISIYGIDPDPAIAGIVDLEPALTLRSEVTFVKEISSGESVGYGHRWTASKPTTLVTVPIGYADGVRRDLGLRGGVVLIGGVRCPIRGVVTMDQLMVDVGSQPVTVGDEVVLIGGQGNESITASDLALTLDTIPYEIVCAISARVPRHQV